MTAQATLPENPSNSEVLETDQVVQSEPAVSAENTEQQSTTKSVEDMTYEEMMALYEKQELERLNAEAAGLAAEPEVTPKAEAEPVAAEEPTPEAGVAAAEEDLKNNYRVGVKGRSDVDKQVVAMIAHNPDMDIATAYAKVTGQSLTPPVAATTESVQTPADTVVNDAPSLEAIKARREEIKAELLAANEAFDAQTSTNLQYELAELIGQELKAEQQQAIAAATKAANEAKEWDRYDAEAATLYPAIADEGSPIREQFLSIYAALEKAQDPLLSKPESTLRVAQMAAAQLSIPPATAVKVAAPVASPPPVAAPPQPAPMRPRPMSGGTSPSAAPANTAAAEQSVANWTPEQWHAFNQSY